MFSSKLSGSRLVRLLATLLSVILVFVLLRREWQQIAETIRQIEISRLLLVLLVMLVSRGFVTIRWHILLRSAGVNSSLSQSSKITFAGLFASNFLPSTVGGDLARMAGALQANFDPTISAASLIVDRVVGLAGMALAMPIGLQKLLLFQSSSTAFPMLASQASWSGKLRNRASRILKKLLAAFKLWLAKPRALFLSLLATLGHMTALFFTIALLLDSVGEEMSFLLIGGLWSLVYLITLVPFTINGLGLQEVSISYAFSQLGGIDLANSLVLALLIRTLFMLASLPGALFLSEVLPGISKAQPILDRIDDAS